MKKIRQLLNSNKAEKIYALTFITTLFISFGYGTFVFVSFMNKH